MPKPHKRHTPITSKKQRGLFGAELARKRAGKKGRMKGITTKELEQHLEESGGKKLPRIAKGHKPNPINPQDVFDEMAGIKKVQPAAKTGRI